MTMVSPAGSRRSTATPTGKRQNTAWDNRDSGQGRMVPGDMVAAAATIIGCAAEVRESPSLDGRADRGGARCRRRDRAAPAAAVRRGGPAGGAQPLPGR